MKTIKTKSVYDLLDLKKEEKYYKRVCKEKKVKLSKYDIEIPASYLQWKNEVKSNIIAGLDNKRLNNKNFNEKEYLTNYKHYLISLKRNIEYDKDAYISILTFLISILISGLISVQISTEGIDNFIEPFLLFIFVLAILSTIFVLNYYFNKNTIIYFYDDLIEILDEYILDKCEDKEE